MKKQRCLFFLVVLFITTAGSFTLTAKESAFFLEEIPVSETLMPEKGSSIGRMIPSNGLNLLPRLKFRSFILQLLKEKQAKYHHEAPDYSQSGNRLPFCYYFGLEKQLLKQKNSKLVAIALAIALGPFGVHRLYLGTAPHVPVIYTLTIGGGFFVLPLADIIAIVLAKDLEQYQDNPRTIMWIK